MGLTGKVGARGAQKMEVERLRREDHLRVKHDKLFSDWKILVGPADWKDQSAGEEGSQRYRLHNLPSSYFGPGVYELGLTQLTTTHSSKQRKLRRHAVVVVYLGQADNVRQRLQRYGQTGSHLEGPRSAPVENVDGQRLEPQSLDIRTKLRASFLPKPTTSPATSIQGGLRLFTEVFSRGYSVAFRWARTESKQLAEKVESELLQVFDYPWNTSLNGARRPRDILAKLDMLQYQLERSLCLGRAVGIGCRKWEYFGRKVGVSVPVKKPAEAPPHRAKIPTSFLLSSAKEGEKNNGATAGSVCGVPLEDGSACGNAPVSGRKRCNMHKGQRAKVSTRRPRVPPTQPQAGHSGAGLGSVTGRIWGRNMARNAGRKTGSDMGSSKPSVVIIRAQMQGKRVEITDVSGEGLLVCGALVGGGSPCLNRPVQGRKRCATHKGIRTSKSNPKESTAPDTAEWSGFTTRTRSVTVVSSSTQQFQGYPRS